MAHAADPYDGIDFDEITENTGLAADEIKCLKVKGKHHKVDYKYPSEHHFKGLL